MPAVPFCHAVLKAARPPPPGYPTHPGTIGEHIRKRRIEQGLTQKALAALLGVSEAAILDWEIHGRAPALRTIPAIVRFLGRLPGDQENLTLGQRLRRCRQVRGLSQKVLARQLNVDPGTLARWESGERRPAGDLLARVVDLLRGFHG